MDKLLEMKLSRLKQLIKNSENSESFIEGVERALSGNGTDLDSRYIYICDQFYKVMPDD